MTQPLRTFLPTPANPDEIAMIVNIPDGRVYEVTGREWHDALRWRNRARKAKAEGVIAGIAESCPNCEHPITLDVGNFWGGESCKCGTAPSDATGWALIELHGLIALGHYFHGDGSATGNRGD